MGTGNNDTGDSDMGHGMRTRGTMTWCSSDVGTLAQGVAGSDRLRHGAVAGSDMGTPTQGTGTETGKDAGTGLVTAMETDTGSSDGAADGGLCQGHTWGQRRADSDRDADRC